MERKLASIRRIAEVKPIEGADAIEAVRVDGWWVVAKKNEFQVDDLVVYFEIDSWIPTAIAPFLTKPGKEPREYEGIKGERLRTVKLRGQISQGLVIPVIKVVPEKAITNAIVFYDADGQPHHQVVMEGMDVTETLGILKYEPPVPAQLAGQIKGMFPGFIKKTDQERIQNLPEWIEKYREVPWEITIKLDGSSMTVYHNNGNTGVCSRNLDLKEDETNTFWRVANHYKILPALTKLGRNLAIQGELIGEGIQGNPEKIKGQDFYVFDIWDIDQQRHLTSFERHRVLEQLLELGCGLKEVPIIHESYPVFASHDTMEKVLWFAGAGSGMNTEIREGLVFKATQPINGEVPSFKAINNTYLLKEK
jgi:RNA ligase (TIGR02306 family)